MHLSIPKSKFNCPKCECLHSEEDYYEKLRNSKTFISYQNCKGCKTKLGISSDITGDVVVWLKSEEKQIN